MNGQIKIELGSPLLLDLKLDDGDSGKFVRAIVRNNAGTAVAGSPFTLSHIANGRYRNTSFTPGAEGNYTADYIVYNDAGFTQISGKYRQAYDLFKVDDTEINVQGLRDNYTNARALKIDFLDVSVASRQSEANALSRFNTTQSELTDVDSDNSAIKAVVDNINSDIGSPVSGSISGDVANVQARADLLETESDASTRQTDNQNDLDTLLSRLSSGRATNLDNLNATVSSRASQASLDAQNDLSIADVQTSLTNQGYTAARSALLDNLDQAISSIATLINGLNDLNIADIQTALTNQGLTSLRAGNLDNLDVTISSRQSEANASSRQTDNQSDLDTLLARLTAIRAGLLDNLDTTISSRATQALATQIDNKIGAPNDNDIATDIANAQAGINTTNSRLSVSRAGNLDNLDVLVSTRASQTSIDNIQNNTAFSSTLPPTIIIPEAGTETLRVFASVFNTSGQPVDPDTNELSLTITNGGGAVIVPTELMTRQGVGVYYYDLVVDFEDDDGQYIFTFDYEIATQAFQQLRTTTYSATANDIALLLSRITQPRAENLDNLDVVLSSRSSQSSLDALSTKVGTPVNSTVSNDIASVKTDTANLESKITPTRASNLDNLDATISSRQSTADADSKQASLLSEHSDTQTDIASVKSDTSGLRADVTSGRASNLDNLDTTISSRESEADASTRSIADQASHTQSQSDIANVQTSADSLNTKLTPGRATNLDNLDAMISSRQSEASANTRNNNSISRDQATQTKIDDVKDVVDGIDIETDANSIADAVWDSLAVSHNELGSFGRALSLLSGEGASLTAETIADAVWDEMLSPHTNGGTFGERIQTIKNRLDVVEGKINTTNARLSVSRAGNLDKIDVVLSSRQSTSDADSKQSDLVSINADTKAVVDGISTTIGQADPEVGSILSILQNPTYGLSQLRVVLNTKSSQISVDNVNSKVASVISSLADGAIGLAVQRALLDSIIGYLSDTDYGLSKLKDILLTKAGSNELNFPSAQSIRDEVWKKAIGGAFDSGSIGEVIKNRLDVTVSSRSSQSSVDAIDAIVDNILDQILNATYGLPELKDSILEAIANTESIGSDISDHDQNLNDTRATILSAIGSITDGTSTIISALEVIKGGGWSAGTDTLERISDRIGAGLAIETKQDQILTNISGIDTKQDALSTKIDQNNSEIQSNRTQLGTKIDNVKVKADNIDIVTTATKAEIDNASYGLSKARSDRNAHKAEIIDGQASLDSGISGISTLINNLDGKIDSNQIDLLNAIGNINLSNIQTLLSGVIAILQDGSIGLAKIKQEILSAKAQEGSNHNASFNKLSTIENKSNTIEGLILAIQGAGFTASDSLSVLKGAIEALATDESDNATQTQAQAILDELSLIKDGGNNNFNSSTDSLKAISESDRNIQGISGSGA